jgi:hypothetical protein
MLTIGVLTGIFVVTLAAVVIPVRNLDGDERAIYCVWCVPGVAIVQAVAVYGMLYRHLRPLFYQAERVVAESVDNITDEALAAHRNTEKHDNDSIALGATDRARRPRSPFDTSLYVETALVAQRPEVADLAEAIRLRRIWRGHQRSAHEVEDSRGALMDVTALRKDVQSACNNLLRLEAKSKALPPAPPATTGSTSVVGRSETLEGSGPLMM